MNNQILDPWNINEEFILKLNSENIIKGPCKIIKNLNNLNDKLDIIRYDVKFNVINKNNSNINISTIECGESGYKLIEIIIKNNNIIKVGHIENISKNNIYSGSDLMIFALQILYRLNIKECTSKDVSYFTCTRNNFFKQTEIPMKIIKLLKSNNTFYSPFGFEPYDKLLNKNKNKMEEIRNLVTSLCQISWNELNEIIISGKNQIDITESQNIKMNYNILEIRNINKWKKYWTTIHNSWIIFKNKFNKSRTPFSAFQYFNEKTNCSDFIDWLELYSFTFFNFNKIIYYKFLNIKYEIPKIKIFNKLKLLLNNIEWRNNNIFFQNDTFIPIKF